ncbi:MAG: hypothetical protein J7621_02145 [Niastella sp.]|nr:hypothetical protein [Niastella sp.]
MDQKKETNRIRLWIFSILLVITILLVILYASGILKFGLAQQFTYILYAVAGLLAAVTCFGLLSSYGKLVGKKEGSNLELRGAIVAFVVVAFGGGFYEKYLHTTEFINMTIAFVNNERQAEDVSGSVTLYIGTEPKTIILRSQNNVTFLGIPSSLLNDELKIELKGNYEIDRSVSLPAISNSAVFIKVKRVNPFISPGKVNLNIEFTHGEIVGFGPDPSTKSVVLRFYLFSRSEKDIPLSNKVKFILYNNNGLPIYTNNHSLAWFPRIKPNAREEIVLDLLIPHILIEQAFDKDAEIILYYDSEIDAANDEYSKRFILTKSDFSIN